MNLEALGHGLTVKVMPPVSMGSKLKVAEQSQCVRTHQPERPGISRTEWRW